MRLVGKVGAVGEFEENIRMARNRIAARVDKRTPAAQVVPGQVVEMCGHPLEPVGRRLCPPARTTAVNQTRPERFHTQAARLIPVSGEP